MAEIDKKEEVKSVGNTKLKDKTKTTPKNYAGVLSLIALLCCAGSVFYNIELTQTLNEDLAAQLAKDYNSKINSLKVDVNKMTNLSQPVMEQTPPTELSEEQLQELAKKVFPLLPKAEHLKETSPQEEVKETVTKNENTVTAPEVLLAAGALTVRGLAEDGLPFDYETEVLQILAAGNETALKYIDNVKKYAVSGIKGQAMLISEFDKIYTDLSGKKTVKENAVKIDETWNEALWRRLKELVELKKREEKPSVVFPKAPDEVYMLVNNGDFAEALNKLKTDYKYGEANSAELNSWILQTQNYLEFKQAINGLIMNSLANLHLKEMERAK